MSLKYLCLFDTSVPEFYGERVESTKMIDKDKCKNIYIVEEVEMTRESKYKIIEIIVDVVPNFSLGEILVKSNGMISFYTVCPKNGTIDKMACDEFALIDINNASFYSSEISVSLENILYKIRSFQNEHGEKTSVYKDDLVNSIMNAIE
jgi:hypothetical protein